MLGVENGLIEARLVFQLKKVIAANTDYIITCDPNRLQLYAMTQSNGEWLASDSESKTVYTWRRFSSDSTSLEERAQPNSQCSLVHSGRYQYAMLWVCEVISESTSHDPLIYALNVAHLT